MSPRSQTLSDHLHLGCGLCAPQGWTNVDGSWQVVLARHPWIKRVLVFMRLLPARQAAIPWSADVVRLNLVKSLPFAEGTFQAIYSSHTLEHLYYADALRLLQECHRILKPGGVCRFVVPDLESIISRYMEARNKREPEGGNRLMEELLVHERSIPRGPLGLYHRITAYHQHKWMYDQESLQQLFREAGFTEVRSAGYLESRIARIAEVEDAGRITEGRGIAVEAVKN